MKNLMAHCDTKRIDEQAVMAVPEPEFTPTWHPISHSRVIEALTVACNDHNLTINSKEYSLSADGGRMFGVWHLDADNGRSSYALGLRNAINKSMALGVCAGTKVFVCDNLCFDGEFIAFRKHTSGLTQDHLVEMSYKAVAGAVIEMEKFTDWHDGLHDVWVPRSDYKGLVFDMMDKGVFSPSNFGKFQHCHREELTINHGKSLDGAVNLYNVHGAATRLMRDWNLLKVSDSTRKLNAVCDSYLDTRN